MDSRRARFILAALLTATLLLALTASALAVPTITYLISPTHPSMYEWYQDPSPVFEWSPVPQTGHLLGSYDTPGSASDVEVLGDHAYLADGLSGLQIIDVSDPANATLAGSLDTPGSASELAISGDQIFIADKLGGLQIASIADPHNPTILGSFETQTPANDVVVRDGMAYVANGEGLQIIGVDDPSNSVIIGYIDLPKGTAAVDLAGNYAYVLVNDYVPESGNAGWHESGFYVLDISDMSNPASVGYYQLESHYEYFQYDYSHTATSITVSGDRLYTTSKTYQCECQWIPFIRTWGTIKEFDISDPANPSYLSTKDLDNYVSDLDVNGSHIVTAQNNAGAALFDAVPLFELANYDTPGNAEGITTDGQYVFVADGDSGLQMIDMIGLTPSVQYSYVLDQSSDTVPDTIPEGTGTTVAYHDLPDGEYWFHVAVVEDGVVGRVSHRRVLIGLHCGQAPDIHIGDPVPMWDNYASYLARELTVEYKLENRGAGDAMDVSVAGFSASSGVTWCDPRGCDYREIGFVDAYDTPGEPKHVAVAGDNLFIADGTSGIQILDISDPANASLTGSFDTPDYARHVHIDGNHAYVADNMNGLLVLDISDLANPELIGQYDPHDYGRIDFVTVRDGYAYLTDSDQGIFKMSVLDVSDPGNPQLLGSVEVPAPARGIALKGNHAYIADYDSGLLVADISSPSSPALVGGYDTPSFAQQVAISDDHAYLADGFSGLIVFDISAPATPVLVGSLSANDYATNVTIDGATAYMSDGLSGLQVIDVGDPSSPGLVDSYDTLGYSRAAAVSGSHIYVADDDRHSGTIASLQVLAFQKPVPPASILSEAVLPSGQIVPFSVKLQVPMGVSNFRTSFTGSAEDACGNSYSYGS